MLLRWRAYKSLSGAQLLNKCCEARLRHCLPIVFVVVLACNAFVFFYGFVNNTAASNGKPVPPPPRDSNHPYLDHNIAGGTTFSASDDLETLRKRPESRDGRVNRLPSPRPFTPTSKAPSLVVASASDTAAAWKPSTIPCRVTSRTGRRKDYGRWYDFSAYPFQLYAYSAVWDDRESLLRQPGVIRVIALSSFRDVEPLTTKPHKVNIEMACRLHYPDGRTAVVVKMDIIAHPIGYSWWLNNEMVREYIFTCPVDSNSEHQELPVAVEVLVGSPSWFHAPSSPCMPIDFPEKPKVRRDLAVCVQVTYGKLDALKLIEWFELQKMLGIEMVGIYNMSIVSSAGTYKVLQHYSQTADGNDGDGGRAGEPFVDLRRSDYIEKGVRQYLLHGSPVINDCVYRNMYRFKRIAVIDLDEFIVPQNENITDLRQLFTQIESNFSGISNPPLHFVFYNNYFFLDEKSQPSEGSIGRPTTVATATARDLSVLLQSELTVLKYLTRVPVSEYGYAVKSIIDPQACLHMHNHYCWGMTPGFKKRALFGVIEPPIALNQHYKYCHFNQSDCDNLFPQTSVHNVMLKYRDKLAASVAAKIKTIFGDSFSISELLSPR